MYRLKVACTGIPRSSEAEAALDIAKEFEEHRRWFVNVRCQWDSDRLVLEADSDVDSDGKALLDEFWDCVAAYVPGDFDSTFSIESVRKL